MNTSMGKQRGVTLSGLLFVAIALVFIAVLGMKILPDVLDYYAILKDIKATAQDPSLREATLPEIRKAFERRLLMDNVSGFSGSDLDINKQGSDIVINFAYSKKISLSNKVSLMIDFEGSSAK